MDPDICLERARKASADIQQNRDITVSSPPSELAVAFDHLDRWMQGGGKPPVGWRITEVPSRRIDVTPTIAQHVLGELEGIYPEPGSFVTSLIKTLVLADRPNRDLLGKGFPGYVAAIATYKDDMDGAQWLKSRAMASER